MSATDLYYNNEFPFFFKSSACTKCGGKCCRGRQGYVWLSPEELKKIADAKGISQDAFARQYVRQVKGQLSLKERIMNNEHFCCFLDPVDLYCTIYAYRPEQCRTFPFWDEFKEDTKNLLLTCPGVSLS